MYNEYFGFKEAPFSIAPDPRYLYMTAQHREALAHLVYGLNSEGGCILLTGEVGTGKTTICRCLLDQIPEQANVALVLNPKVDETELLETICDELDITYPDQNNTLKTYTDKIYQFLIESNRRNEKTVLIIDEAQNLDSKVLEQLRLLTNLETNKRKLLQIIILGQPELLTILAKSELRQLAQRITARFHLKPLSKQEVKTYISHRLAVAGQSIQLFPDSSVTAIYKLSKGVPRLINILCDRSLLGAYVEDQYAVNTRIVKKAATEVFGELKNVEVYQKNKRWLYPLTAVSGVIVLILLIVFLVQTPKTKKTQLVSAEDTAPIEQVEQKADDTPNTLITNTEIPITGNASSTDKAIEANITAPNNTNNTETNNLNDTLLSTTSNNSDIEVQDNNNTEQLENKINKKDIVNFDSIVEAASEYPDSAYQDLFKAWQHELDTSSKVTACRQAKQLALTCLFRYGNISSLKLHNRPAVLTLINNNGVKRYITITAINDDIATIYSNNTPHEIKLKDLDKYWHGQYTLLWNKPEHYSTLISPGDSGEIITWLNEQLEKINNTSNPNVIIGKYDDRLARKVKNFQAQKGLLTDGIVGPVTIIHMNNELGMITPLLITSSEKTSTTPPATSDFKLANHQH